MRPNQWGGCTAAVIGDRRTVVSNLHCMPADWPADKPFLFDLQGRTPVPSVLAAGLLGDKQSMPAGLYRARLWKKGILSAEKYWAIEQDWAIFNLDHPVPGQIQPLGLIDQSAFEDYEQGKFSGTTFHVAGFAQDAADMKRMIYVTGCGIPLGRRVVSARAYNTIVDCPSYYGTSGAPILLWKDSEFRLFGLHYAGEMLSGRRQSVIHISWDLIAAINEKTRAGR